MDGLRSLRVDGLSRVRHRRGTQPRGLSHGRGTLTYQLGSSRAILPKVELRCSLMSLSAAKSLARMPVAGVLQD